MNKKIKKFSIFATFMIAGFGLLAGLLSINPSKSLQQVRADDTNNYYLTGSMNEWNLADTTYPLEKIGPNQFKFEGLLDGGAAYVKFKISGNGTWNPQYGYWNLDDESKPLFNDDDGNIEVGAKNSGIVIILDTAIFKINATYEPYTLPNIVQASKAGINPNYMRIWLDRGIFESGGALNALQFGPEGTVTDESTIYEASGYRRLFPGVGENDEGAHWLAYFDIPILDLTAGMDVRVVRVSNKRDQIWNRTEFYTWSVGDNNEVLYVGDDWDNITLSPGIIDDEKEVPVAFLKDVLEGYLTCLDSPINGYGAFPKMNRTFFKNGDGDWKIVGELGDIELTDYVSMDKTYVGGRVENNVDGYTKYAAMEALHGVKINGSGLAQVEKSNNLGITLIIGMLSITALGAFYFLSKKKYI